ncbi:unnamed protein product, partial [Discosporangium mesarthrocarpum]
WAENEKLCFHVARLARKLCIPVTSASSERLFSQAGLILSQRRARLKSHKISTIAFLRGRWATDGERL